MSHLHLPSSKSKDGKSRVISLEINISNSNGLKATMLGMRDMQPQATGNKNNKFPCFPCHKTYSMRTMTLL